MGVCFAQEPEQVATFGTTVVIPMGLEGNVYFISSRTKTLPSLNKKKSVGKIYTTSLNIEPREFSTGFPGISARFEWFAIDYTGRFWVEKPGEYRFMLVSDDGSKMWIDGKTVVNNDGIHGVLERDGTVELSGGIHRLRVSYFQGPRFHVALVLKVAGPGENWRIFNTNDFKPAHPEDWKEEKGKK